MIFTLLFSWHGNAPQAWAQAGGGGLPQGQAGGARGVTITATSDTPGITVTGPITEGFGEGVSAFLLQFTPPNPNDQPPAQADVSVEFTPTDGWEMELPEADNRPLNLQLAPGNASAAAPWKAVRYIDGEAEDEVEGLVLVAWPLIETMFNGTPNDLDDYVCVSPGTAVDPAATLGITVVCEGLPSLPLQINHAGDGAVTFNSPSVQAVPGEFLELDFWGAQPSSDRDTTKIELSVHGNLVASEDVTVFRGVRIQFAGRFYSDIDARAEGWRPHGGGVTPTNPVPVPANALPEVVNQEFTNDYSSKIAFADGDQGLNRRPWAPVPLVHVVEVHALEPAIRLEGDPLDNVNVRVALNGGKFEHNNMANELIENVHASFSSGQTDYFSVANPDAADWSAIAFKAMAAGVSGLQQYNQIVASRQPGVNDHLVDWFVDRYGLDAPGLGRDFLQNMSAFVFEWTNAELQFQTVLQPEESMAVAALALHFRENGKGSIAMTWELGAWTIWPLTGQLRAGVLETITP